MSDVVPTSVELAISRMEGAINGRLADMSNKLDVAIVQTGGKLEQHGKEIAELRTKLEVEQQKSATYVTWKSLGAVITLQLAGLWPLINVLTK